uniref:Uncharacterized protein n=1 Tax=Anguilla anguilla TaxID=7936 RepID=A0A0E9WHI8_ANGAN
MKTIAPGLLARQCNGMEDFCTSLQWIHCTFCCPTS